MVASEEMCDKRDCAATKAHTRNNECTVYLTVSSPGGIKRGGYTAQVFLVIVG